MSGDQYEFTDTYSDDVIFLQTIRNSLLRHPFDTHLPATLDPTLARLYAVMSVGNVESAISREFGHTRDARLESYFKGRSVTGREKVDVLYEYLNEQLGVVVDREVLEDYLAIKYLRNGIIHSDQRKGEQKNTWSRVEFR